MVRNGLLTKETPEYRLMIGGRFFSYGVSLSRIWKRTKEAGALFSFQKDNPVRCFCRLDLEAGRYKTGEKER